MRNPGVPSFPARRTAAHISSTDKIYACRRYLFLLLLLRRLAAASDAGGIHCRFSWNSSYCTWMAANAEWPSSGAMPLRLRSGAATQSAKCGIYGDFAAFRRYAVLHASGDCVLTAPRSDDATQSVLDCYRNFVGDVTVATVCLTI